MLLIARSLFQLKPQQRPRSKPPPLKLLQVKPTIQQITNTGNPIKSLLMTRLAPFCNSCVDKRTDEALFVFQIQQASFFRCELPFSFYHLFLVHVSTKSNTCRKYILRQQKILDEYCTNKIWELFL